MKSLLLLALPFAEIWMLFKVGDLIGWWLLVWLVGGFMVGSRLMRAAAVTLRPHMQGQVLVADPGNPALLRALCWAFAGFLFIVPGVISDALAVLLLLPPVQQRLFGQLAATLQSRGQAFPWGGAAGGFGGPFTGGFGNGGFGGTAGQGGWRQPDIFEGEAQEVHPEPTDVTPPKALPPARDHD